MMEQKDLIYSPNEHIPIGEAILLPNGSHGIRFKRKRKTGDVEEIVTLEALYQLVMQNKLKPKPVSRGHNL